MSGIVGIVHLDGRPVDRELLGRMTQFMAYRGPDDQQVWVDGRVGFGHTMLRTTDEATAERQPCTLDGEVWITADVRVDGRAELINKLRGRGARGDLPAATDPELILHAYEAWGEGCLEHLLGDFAFAIWDGRRQRLFCARDPFGVKLFYYARVGDAFVLSNTLDCVRQHPVVSAELNELAIADFLLFGVNENLATTTFADVQRIPPAHMLTVDGARRELQLSRYWTLALPEPIRYRRAGEYTEHFGAVFRAAVGDRLRTDRVSIPLSGGLDSTTIAATAWHLVTRGDARAEFRAYSAVFDSLVPDDDRELTAMTARSLGIPLRCLAVDDYPLFDRLAQPALRRPEPQDNATLAIFADLGAAAASHARVALSGDGGDELLAPEGLSVQLRHGPPWRAMLDVVAFLVRRRTMPHLGTGIRAKLQFASPRAGGAPRFPQWLREKFVRANGLRERYAAASASRGPADARQLLTAPIWQPYLESLDVGVRRTLLETRLPFLDSRVVGFVLAVPPIPWRHEKELLRVAMRGTLPAPVLSRKKMSPRGLLTARLWQFAERRSSATEPSAAIGHFIDLDALPALTPGGDPATLCMTVRSHLLDHWCRHAIEVLPTPSPAELEHDHAQV